MTYCPFYNICKHTGISETIETEKSWCRNIESLYESKAYCTLLEEAIKQADAFKEMKEDFK